MPVTKSTFDQASNVTLYTIANASKGLQVKIIDYGATLVSVIFADRNKVPRDVVLGFDTLDGYQNKGLRNPYFGASVGRVANRIANASFALNGKRYELFANNGANSLHGGAQGFDKRKWSLAAEDESSITLEYLSADGEENYPGALKVQIKFSVTDSNELRLEYSAKLLEKDQSTETIVNLTNHTYFNLNGVFSEESSTILDNVVLMKASKYLEIDDALIPTGVVAPTKGTLLDFSEPHSIGERTHQVVPNGYDHCYVLDDDATKFRINPQQLEKAVEVFAPQTGIKMTMKTTEPAFQLYTGSKIVDGHKPKSTQSTNVSVKIGSYSGFCLEAQRYPDAINKDQWRKQVVLSGGHEYKQTTIYQFEISNGI